MVKKVNCFKILAEMLPDKPSTGVEKTIYWSDGDEILCSEESSVIAIVDLIKQMYAKYGEEVCILTGYYDPVEDERNNEADEKTGWYYITI